MVTVSNLSFWWGWKETQADSLQVHDVPGEPQGEGHHESWQEVQRSWEYGPDIEHLPSMSKALGLSPSPQEEKSHSNLRGQVLEGYTVQNILAL